MHYVVNGLADSNHQNLIDRSHYILLSLFMMRSATTASPIVNKNVLRIMQWEQKQQAKEK